MHPRTAEVEEEATVDEPTMLARDEELINGELEVWTAEDETPTLLLWEELGNVGGDEDAANELETTTLRTELLCILLDAAILLVTTGLGETSALLVGFVWSTNCIVGA
jgi:hypothetical protein